MLYCHDLVTVLTNMLKTYFFMEATYNSFSCFAASHRFLCRIFLYLVSSTCHPKSSHPLFFHPQKHPHSMMLLKHLSIVDGVFLVICKVSFLPHSNTWFDSGLIWPKHLLSDVCCGPYMTCGKLKAALILFFLPHFHNGKVYWVHD